MRPSRQFPRLFAVVLALLQLSYTTPAFARGSNENETARAERSQGTIALNLGKYDEAVDHFSRAYSISQDPALLFFLAQAYRLSGKADKALATYSAFLRAAGGTAKYRAQIERAASEIESITSFMLNHPVDTRAADKPAAVVEVAPPPVVPVAPVADVEIEPPSVVETKPVVEIAPSGVAAVEPSALLPKPEPAKSPAVDFAADKKESEQPPPHPVYKRWWFWTTTAVVLAAGGAAAWWYTRPVNDTPASTYGSVKVLP